MDQIISQIQKSNDDPTSTIGCLLRSIHHKFPEVDLKELVNCVSEQKEKVQSEQKDEILFLEENRRFTIFPIPAKFDKIWKMYKKQQACAWTAEEVDFSKDHDDYMTLSSNEQYFLKMTLAFFAASDGIVNFNLNERFTREVTIMEVQVLYNYQKMMEDIHGHVYSLMLDEIIKDQKEKDQLFRAIETIPIIKKMADWAFKWIESTKSFAYRVIAFAIVEGVFFSGSFASIYWFKKRNKMPGLTKSNEWIARDEGQHCDTACMLYTYIKNRVPVNEVYSMFDEGVNISCEFMTESLPCGLIGMNSTLMTQYIKYIADRLIVSLGYPKKYNTKNPFKFMETIGLPGKSNFFEQTESGYQDANVMNTTTNKKINILTNF